MILIKLSDIYVCFSDAINISIHAHCKIEITGNNVRKNFGAL